MEEDVVRRLYELTPDEFDRAVRSGKVGFVGKVNFSYLNKLNNRITLAQIVRRAGSPALAFDWLEQYKRLAVEG